MILADAALKVSDEAFAYLRLQRGRISDLSADRQAWEAAYSRELAETYHQVAPWLPDHCGALLDIGSGLGGIDVLLSQHYRPAPQVWLLDGIEDAPATERHDTTFNSMRVARAFLADNGVRMAGFFSPCAADDTISSMGFDLIVSTQAWGFHIEPATYLAFVRRNLAAGGRLVIDLRRGRHEWLDQMLKHFRALGYAYRSGKFDRVVFAAR